MVSEMIILILFFYIKYKTMKDSDEELQGLAFDNQLPNNSFND